MELRQLRYFAVLAEELNFTRAAAYLTAAAQPADRAAGRELGVTVRPQQPPRALTEAGEAFLNDVRVTLGRLKDATVRAQAVDQEPGRPHRDRFCRDRTSWGRRRR